MGSGRDIGSTLPLTCIERSTGQGWTDVSNEILRELDLILTSQQGDDWRDNLSRRNQKLAPMSLLVTPDGI